MTQPSGGAALPGGASDYTGTVTPGGPSALRRLDEVEIRKVAVGPMDNNAYLVTCRGSGAQLLIDAAADADRLLALVREGNRFARLDLVVTTHRHRDHVGALPSVVAVTGAPTAAGADDAASLPVAVHQRLVHGDVLSIGHLTLDVVGLRGHTPGSIALVYREPEQVHVDGAVAGRAHVFTGDSLFPGGVGNTDLDAARFSSLLADVESRVFGRYGDDTWVYPGHGADTTLGAERPHLAEWRDRGW